MDWIRVEDRLPQAMAKVIAFYRNSSGNGRTVFAEYVHRWTVLAEDFLADDANGDTEWTEDGELEYVAESWHELIDNWGDLSGCVITDGTVTHWMPAPAHPSK